MTEILYTWNENEIALFLVFNEEISQAFLDFYRLNLSIFNCLLILTTTCLVNNWIVDVITAKWEPEAYQFHSHVCKCNNRSSNSISNGAYSTQCLKIIENNVNTLLLLII